MSYLHRQTTKITGVKRDEHDLRRESSGSSGTGKVPNAKKPRSRPPTGLRDKLGFLQGHLPHSSGPYSVGSMDVEVPAEHPRTFSNITRKGHHLLQLKTVLFTLYYPAALGSGAGKDPGGRRNWSRETWVPRPRRELAKGYAKFAGISDSLAIAYVASTTMFTKLRAFRNSPLATHWPPEGNFKRNGHKIKNQRGSPPPEGSDQPIFPVLFFSHGLGGTRTAYSTMCAEFASYGFVVCALEHRDGSGPRTFVNHTKEGAGSIEEREHKGQVDHSEEEKRNGYDTIDYIFPKDNPYDTSPSNEKGVDSELRTAQIELRLAEIEEAYRVLRDICEGRGEEVARLNMRQEGYMGGSSRGLEGVDWSNWTKRFHVDKVTVAGHSFGAATVVELLRNTHERFENVQAGIIYDIWGAPIKPPRDDPQHRIHLPLLGINSEAFMYWQSNFDAVTSLMNEAEEQGAPAYLCTVRGSVHISQSDFSVLYNHVTSLFLKATVHPHRAIDLNISASLEFLKTVTEGAGKSIIERCLTDEELLEAALLDQLPDDHKPEDEYIAAKLKVHHEFRTRVAARVQRKIKRKKAHGFYKPGDEMLMHFKPSKENLLKWLEKKKHADKEVPIAEGKSDAEQVISRHDRETAANSEDDDTVTETESGHASSSTAHDTWLGCPPTLKSSRSGDIGQHSS
ncbi:platelet-activating factor acetylhydrolase, isoform II-domain-containing protein [Massariosphaeria phaeospora]|uniref:1-alkyl-2-acetylglycerophosphocholine esterase n=1 Tax=Massariosphaeria phaeospora TaxID=100035 RepID=A0A7C8MG67_9PLEO|nr:platelet-activating factor acetylhydrolase, isoform II-domain-containing protein [Massariosphaeria phaeospora]